jgi:HSP20 family protein
MATEKTMERRGNQPLAAEQTRIGRSYGPNVDILETPDELILLADMPGSSGEDIDIHFEGGELAIHGRVRERQPEGTVYLLREYGIGEFYRTFQISESINSQGISAELSDGVLALHMPKVEAVKPRRIAVKTI